MRQELKKEEMAMRKSTIKKKKKHTTYVLYRHYLGCDFLTLSTTALFLFAEERKTFYGT